MRPLVDIRSNLGIDFEKRLLGFTYESNDRAKDKITLKLDNRDAELIDWYPPGASAAVRWGYPGNRTPWRMIQFRRIRGFSTLTFEANSLESILDRIDRTDTYYGVTSSQVVGQIAKRYGFSGRLLHLDETDTYHDVINQLAESDAVFLKRLAVEEGFVFYVDDTGLHWHAPKYEDPPARILQWRGSDQSYPIIGEPQLEFDLLRHYRRIKKKSHDPETKSVDEEEIDISTDVDAKELGAKGTNDNVQGTEWIIDETGTPKLVTKIDAERALAIVEKAAEEDSSLMAFAQKYKQDPTTAKLMTPALIALATAESVKILNIGSAKKQKRSLAAVNIGMTVKVEGEPSWRAGEVIRFLGLPKIIEGNFYVKRVVHNIESGYDCDLLLRKHNPESNPRKGKLENTGASVNKSEDPQESKPKPYIDENGRVVYHPPGYKK